MMETEIVHELSDKSTNVIYVPEHAVVHELIGFNTYAPSVADKKLVVVLGAHASVLLRGEKATLLFEAFSTINWYCGQSSQLTMMHDQDYTKVVYDSLRINFFLDRESRLDYSLLITGPIANKVEIDIALRGEGAQAMVRGAYLISQTQQIEVTTMQHHQAANTRSDVVIKGALQDAAQSCYRGTIFIAPEARGTVASQENKNMLMSNAARAQSIPALEVLNNDVQCSHGSAVGQFDQEQLFYAAARGLDEKRARRILIKGFFADLFSADESKKVLQERIDRQLF